MKNAYVACSHPLLINFENTLLFDSLTAGETYSMPLLMRLSIQGDIQIKFLIRYEVGNDDTLPSSSRFRF